LVAGNSRQPFFIKLQLGNARMFKYNILTIQTAYEFEHIRFTGKFIFKLQYCEQEYPHFLTTVRLAKR
jgi:hypothetical protein